MRNFVQRLLGIGRTRAFDAAGGGRRWESAKTVDGLNAAILAGATTAARRAGWYARNNPWVAAAVDSLVGNVVGAGIKPQSAHPDRAVREALQALWLRWTDHADAGGLGDLYGLQAMAVRAMIESGEAFARLKVARDTPSGIVPLRLDLLDREQVPLDLHRDIGGGARIRAGIEFDSAGQRVAYHVHASRLGDPLAPLRFEPVRVPAADLLHLFKPLAAGQLRGITWLAPVLLRLHELDQFEDAALVKAKVAALFTGFITDPDGTVGGLSGTGNAGVLQVGMEPGSLIPLPPGADIRFSNPTEHDAYAPFVKNHLRAVAAGLGLPYELVSGDLEGVTYSSIRAGLIEFRRRVEQLQHNVVVHLFCRPVWERFLRLAVLSGDLPARNFDRDPAAYLGCEWLPPKFDYVDPMKDVQAEIMAIGAGLKSRSQAISERGYDAEQVDAEIAADQSRATALGLDFSRAKRIPTEAANA
ncbi:lambda family phage portal protein [Tepidamorphus gemmatus]|uniref:Lambda family phage portal protein n=1 Tax=Tepidamorphus gemmatus TaxID=747076 RepID=A0A4R3LXM1_9HYPH|nr:phage portal protein [Tepidamorphus gemmatus]TCT05390.1 lambda family phage portal protein [Tepidamorphus gemmatus]